MIPTMAGGVMELVATSPPLPFHRGTPLQKPKDIIMIDDDEDDAAAATASAVKLVAGIVILDDDDEHEVSDARVFSGRSSTVDTDAQVVCHTADRIRSKRSVKANPISSESPHSTPVDLDSLHEAAHAKRVEEPVHLASSSSQLQPSAAPSSAPKRRRSSAARDYPVGCGRNVAFSSGDARQDDKSGSYLDIVENTRTDNPGKNLESSPSGMGRQAEKREKSNTHDPDDAGTSESKDKERAGADNKLCVKQMQGEKGSFSQEPGKLRHSRPIRKGQKAVISSQACSPTGRQPENGLEMRETPDQKRLSARALVKQTLHEFESIRMSLSKNRTGDKPPHLQAATRLRKEGKWRKNDQKIIGEVPGVDVGDQFTFRIEMLMIGLHRMTQGGIDFISGKKRTSGAPIAISIVASGGYEDDDDGGDTFVYTGQGGNNYGGDKRQQRNQTLVRGNLAMTNSCKEKIPVRVIRGFRDPASPKEKLYTYDGLYDVVDYWFRKGLAGFGVYQFKLARRPGQPELGSSIVRFVGKLKNKGIARPHLLVEDISEGKEIRPVCVVNEVDDEPRPASFTYIANIMYPSWLSPDFAKGCDCLGNCIDEEKCACAAKNGGQFPYNGAGRLVETKEVVFECGSSCSCSSSCQNRVSQRGLRYQLEIFKTKNKGWGVRSLDPIRPGGFICQYTGELLSDAEAEQRKGNDEYLFDIGNNWNSRDDELDHMNTSSADIPVVKESGYTIDAKNFGNVARFINHSCSPNLFASNVFFDCDDLRFPHVMLFAGENIPPMRELTYDYNYTIGDVSDAYGNEKIKACQCGAPDCRGRLY